MFSLLLSSTLSPFEKKPLAHRWGFIEKFLFVSLSMPQEGGIAKYLKP